MLADFVEACILCTCPTTQANLFRYAPSSVSHIDNNGIVINVTPTLSIDGSSVLHQTAISPTSSPLVLHGEGTDTTWNFNFFSILLNPAAAIASSTANPFEVLSTLSWS